MDDKTLAFAHDLKSRPGPAPQNVKSILAVCSANVCRSPMVEGYLQHRLKKSGHPEIIVASAGTMKWSGQPASEHSVTVLDEIGIDIFAHLSRSLTAAILDKNDLVLVMEKAHLEFIEKHFPAAASKTYLLGDFSPRDTGKDIDDPVGMPIEFYRAAFDRISKCVDMFLIWLFWGQNHR